MRTPKKKTDRIDVNYSPARLPKNIRTRAVPASQLGLIIPRYLSRDAIQVRPQLVVTFFKSLVPAFPHFTPWIQLIPTRSCSLFGEHHQWNFLDRRRENLGKKNKYNTSQLPPSLLFPTRRSSLLLALFLILLSPQIAFLLLLPRSKAIEHFLNSKLTP